MNLEELRKAKKLMLTSNIDCNGYTSTSHNVGDIYEILDFNETSCRLYLDVFDCWWDVKVLISGMYGGSPHYGFVIYDKLTDKQLFLFKITGDIKYVTGEYHAN